jgi:hypothetical protein
VALVEALWPVLAWRTNAVVGCEDLEGGGTLTLDYMCYGPQELDRQRIPTFVHAQHIFEDSLFFARSEVLLVGCFVLSCRPTTGVTPCRRFAG